MILPTYWRKADLDLGSEHYVWIGHSPEWPEKCECGGIHSEDFSNYFWLAHPNAKTGEYCLGACNTRPGGWVLESREPLTLSPSIACSCGDHGFIRDGRWVPA